VPPVTRAVLFIRPNRDSRCSATSACAGAIADQAMRRSGDGRSDARQPSKRDRSLSVCALSAITDGQAPEVFISAILQPNLNCQMYFTSALAPGCCWRGSLLRGAADEACLHRPDGGGLPEPCEDCLYSASPHSDLALADCDYRHCQLSTDSQFAREAMDPQLRRAPLDHLGDHRRKQRQGSFPDLRIRTDAVVVLPAKFYGSCTPAAPPPNRVQAPELRIHQLIHIVLVFRFEPEPVHLALLAQSRTPGGPVHRCSATLSRSSLVSARLGMALCCLRLAQLNGVRA
jgi:hypothetical protein